jgi:gliding motility-associated-like protein
MRNKKILLFAFSFLVVMYNNVYTQTQQVNHDVPFSSGNQNMWGPSWSAFSINQNINLFNVSWNESFGTGNGGIITILGQQFGAAIQGAFSGTLGSNFSLSGFTTGEVNVDYPIKVDLTMTNDLTYDQGDRVIIQTEYNVEPGYALETFYPSVGEAKLDVYFRLAGNLSATLCAFGCTTFPVIPNFDTGMNTINVFTANVSGVSLFSFNGGTPLFDYPFLPLTTDMISGDPLGEFGISGSLTVPYVITDDYLSGDNLYACGDSTYVTFNLNIFDLIGGLNIPYVSAVAGNLAGSEDFGFGTVYWNFFDASFEVNIHNKQCFDFTPKVYGKFEFPVAVDYRILSPLGVALTQGTSSIVNIEIGNRLEYKFPCYFEEINIVPTYSIDGQFTNHTYDSISFDFLMSAFAFGINIPSITITPAIHVPQICIPIPYPCPTWTKPWRWCTKQVCTPAFTIPAIIFPGITYDFGPLWSTAIPLGSIKYDWYHNTWKLEGFDEYTFPAFKMIANKLRVSINQNDILCYDGNNGSIDITTHAVSPANPYSYVWTNGATTQNLTNLTAGPYEVEIYDANNCQLFIGATLTQPEHPIGISYTKTDKLCNSGINDGSIDVFVQGGTAPYSYDWDNGDVTEDISGLGVGQYILTVTDDNGCLETLDVRIEEPSSLNQVGEITPVTCKGEDTGTIRVNPYGGTLPYSFLWSTGQTKGVIENLTADTYTLTLRDANGCEHVQSYIINEPAQGLNVTASPTDVLCKNNSTGSIDVTTTGGTSGYVYTWINSSGVVLPHQTEDISGITAGTYTVLVRDNNNCTAQAIAIINEPAASLQSHAILQHVDCYGDATGQIDPVIVGGTSAYSYAWSDGTFGAILNNADAGVHTLTVTDANNCITTFNYELIQPENPLSLVLTATDVLCHGHSTGQVTSTVSGGTEPYVFVWSNGSPNGSIQNLTSDNYLLNIVDAHGCTISNNVMVNEPSAPLAVSTLVTDVDCYGNNTGEIVLTVTGGTTPYQYAWTNGSTFVMVETTATISNQNADTYSAVITDANGCKIPFSAVINGPTAPLAVNAVIDDVNCFGMADGGIDVSVSGGTGPYTYSWSNGGLGEDILSVVADTYTLTVTDANSCELIESFIVKEPATPLVATLTQTPVKCNGGSDGKVVPNVTGGTMPYTYSWSGGETSEFLTGITGGIYSLTVTDAQGCTAFTGTTVEEPTSSLIVNTVVNDVQCHGADDGSIELLISGGVQPYYYNWGNQNEILVNNFSEIISNLTNGTYFIRVTDRNGCKNEQYVQVNQPQPMNVQYLVSDVLCFGDNSGSIDLTVTGGTPNYTFAWSNGQTTEDAIDVYAGNHTVIITDAQLCEHREVIFVGEPNKLDIAYQIREVGCIDQSDAAIFIAPYGGVKPYQYDWSNGVISQNNENLKPGNYALILTDANGCVATYSFEISESNHECVFIPNTITPNGDNYNDTWIIENIDLYPNAEIRVFNKWGNMVFESVGAYQPWKGTHHGNPLPSEVYYYIITLGNDEKNEYTGTITIIR